MAEIRDYSTNPDPQTTDRWPENMAMSAVNDTGRVDEGILARWYRDTRGDIVSSGTANAYVITANRSFSGGYDGLEMAFQANFTNTGAATLEISGGVTATSIVDRFGQPLTGREIQSGAKIRVVYGSSNWILLASSERAREEINVKDYGALGDGSNADQAFSDAESDRSSLGWQKTMVPDGSYLLTAAPEWDRITGPGKISYNGDSVPAGDIVENITLNVPSGAFPTINAAWDYLSARTIVQSALVVIQVADGTYQFSGTLTLNHPQGGRIILRGNSSTPANCILEWTNGGATDAITVTAGNVLGFLGGFTIKLPAKADWPNAGSGVKAFNGAYIEGANSLIVENFYYGFFARSNATIRANGVTVKNAGDVGIFGFLGGYVQCDGATVTDTKDTVRGLGTGILAEHNGTVECVGATVTGSLLWEIAAVNNGHLRIDNQSGTTTGVEPFLKFFNQQVQVQGGDTTEDIILNAKGPGALVQLDTTYSPSPTSSIGGIMPVRDASGTIRNILVRED